ncbi:MAG: tetratricopeptide repeat protein [Deltaproteobacteria bacterium]|nr:tetratricopeptide repeat protein [Deltaproteobacteria bacterium]
MNRYKKRISSASQGPKFEILLLALLVIIVILIYADTLTTPFIFDDISNIKDNPHIRVPFPSLRNLAWAGFHSPETNRPIANISFALNYYFHGYNLVGFHLVNILIHIAAGIFLYLLIKATLTTPTLRSRYEKFGWIPFFATFIWMVHPLQTQSIAYLVQRMNSMAAMFYVLSLLLYVRCRLAASPQLKWSLFAGCVVSGVLACGTKEIAVTLPLFIILYEWYFFQGLSRQWARRHFLSLGGIVVLLIFISLAYLGDNPLARIFSAYNFRDFTLPQRALTEFRVVIFYISLLLWPQPSRLNLDHDFAISFSLTDPVTTLFSIAAITALIAVAIMIARREPLLSFSILWFFGNLVIESSVIGLELVFEHRNYLPSMFAIAALVSLVFRYLKRSWLPAVSLCIVGILFTAWTFERNRVWADEITLYQDSAEKSPQKARPHNNLGAALSRRGRLPEAIDQFRAAIRIKPEYADAHYNLGYALARQGNLEEGIYHFAEALRLQPNNVKAHNNMGVALALQGQYPQAIDHFEAALKIYPKDADVHNNFGYTLKKQGKLDAALQHFSAALKIDPEHTDALNNFGHVLMSRGQHEAAARYFSRALEINPGYQEARRNLEEVKRLMSASSRSESN